MALKRKESDLTDDVSGPIQPHPPHVPAALFQGLAAFVNFGIESFGILFVFFRTFIQIHHHHDDGF